MSTTETSTEPNASVITAVRGSVVDLTLDALEMGARAATQKLESGFVSRFARAC